MSVKTLHTNFDTFYYVTFTCLQWINLFDITHLHGFILNWFTTLEKRLVYNCGYVIMPNHLHLLLYTLNKEKTINKIIGDSKRFLTYEIVNRLENLGNVDLLKILSDAVTKSERRRGKKHSAFIDSFDCKEIITEKFIRQKLNYIHKNPVSGKWKLVENYLDYKYSSARFYDLGEKVDYCLYHYSEMPLSR